MRRSRLTGPMLAAVLTVSYLGMAGAVIASGYKETDLVVGGPDADQVTKTLTDANGIKHTANFFDANLVNSWGLTETPTGSPFWISDNGSGRSTLYNVNPDPSMPPQGQLTRVVSIPSPGDPLGHSGTPTGAAWNPTSAVGVPAGNQEFKIQGFLFPTCSQTTAVATFLFVTEDGTIVGWNSNLYPTLAMCLAATAAAQNNNAIIAVDNSARGQGAGKGVGTGKGKGNGLGAVYKGLAIATTADGATFLYATNFRAGRVEIYDGTFALVNTFTDRNVPTRYAPFNISPINGKLFVTFAVQDADRHDDVAGQGNGVVDTFDLSGNMLQRFAEHGALNSPWGVALTPASFGDLANTLWIGNFGNGQINAYDADSGNFIGSVRDPHGQSIVIDGLWAIRFGSGLGNGGSSNTLYFTAGPNGEMDGLFGSLSPN